MVWEWWTWLSQGYCWEYSWQLRSGESGDGKDQPVVVGDGGGDGGVEAPISPILRIGGLSEVEPGQSKTLTRM